MQPVFSRIAVALSVPLLSALVLLTVNAWAQEGAQPGSLCEMADSDDVQMLDRYGLAEPIGSITIHQAGKSDKQILLILVKPTIILKAEAEEDAIAALKY